MYTVLISSYRKAQLYPNDCSDGDAAVISVIRRSASHDKVQWFSLLFSAEVAPMKLEVNFPFSFELTTILEAFS